MTRTSTAITGLRGKTGEPAKELWQVSSSGIHIFREEDLLKLEF
jgi:hypothetical protein